MNFIFFDLLKLIKKDLLYFIIFQLKTIIPYNLKNSTN
jgi:hypothetical protein